MPDSVLKNLLNDNSFEKLSGGRRAGEENIKSHYRKGIEGDWRNVMTPKVMAQFKELTGDLVEYIGYSW